MDTFSLWPERRCRPQASLYTQGNWYNPKRPFRYVHAFSVDFDKMGKNIVFFVLAVHQHYPQYSHTLDSENNPRTRLFYPILTLVRSCILDTNNESSAYRFYSQLDRETPFPIHYLADQLPNFYPISLHNY